LPGDLEPAGMAALREAEPDLRADAMLWPHHGHAPEAVGGLAVACGAHVLVVSSAPPFAPSAKPEWQVQNRVASFNTGEVGAVTIELRPGQWHVETFCETGQADVVSLADDEGDKEGTPD